MKDVNEFFPYVQLMMVLVSAILAVVLTISAKNLVAKGWLVAYTVITLVTWPVFLILPIIAERSGDWQRVYYWFDVFHLPTLFGTACFGLFLFANWSRSRTKLDLKNLLFSFSGRISRSAFWISACILFPLGTLLGFAPFITKTVGITKIIIWIFYAAWFIPSTWISFAVYAKRWHDCSKSGWMSLILLIPIIGPFWFLGYLGFVRGTLGPNPYGDDPLDIHVT